VVHDVDGLYFFQKYLNRASLGGQVESFEAVLVSKALYSGDDENLLVLQNPLVIWVSIIVAPEIFPVNGLESFLFLFLTEVYIVRIL
jgi:hypothetical protein